MFRSFLIRTGIGTILCMVLFSVAQAQVKLPTLPDQSTITLRSTNDHPHPFQKITLSIESFSIDLPSAKITWIINGKVVASAVGETAHFLTLGAIGSKAIVKVIADVPDGPTLTDEQTYVTATVDLLWQAHGYTPLFYDGKALLANQGDVTVVAIPQFDDKGIKAGSKDFVYTWKKDGQVLGDVSGYGRDAITVKGTLLVRPINLNVTVSTPDGKIAATATTLIQSQSPIILIYENNPLYGTLLNQALNPGFSMKDKEIHLRALPFYFSTNAYHSVTPLEFDWNVNKGATIPKQDESIVLRQPDNKTKGQSSVEIEVTNHERLLQQANANTTIYFNASE